jgi:hypothetical protein
MPAVDADVVFVAEGWDREIDARCAVRARLGLGVFDRPARVAVLLAQLGQLVRPCGRDAACLMFSPSVLRCLGAATIEASMIWPLIAKNPAAESAASKRSNKASIAGLPAIRACIASAKSFLALASNRSTIERFSSLCRASASLHNDRY